MTRQDFFQELSLLLGALPPAEREQALIYYGEIIADSMEDGLTEEDAVARLGSIRLVAESILANYPGHIPSLKRKPAGRSALNVILLILGFPLWGSLLLTVVMLLLTAYILLYVPIFVLGTFVVTFFGVGLWAIVGSPFLMGDIFSLGIVQLGAGLDCVGLSLLCLIAFYFTLRGILKATKWLWRKSTGIFHKKEAAI